LPAQLDPIRTIFLATAVYGSAVLRRSLLAAAVVVLAGCGAGVTRTTGVPAELPAAEGHLNLVAFPGYAEAGGQDPRVNWVTRFVQTTGCKVHVRTVRSSTELLDVVVHGRYDGVLSGGDVSRVLIGGREAAPLNRSLIPHYAQVYPALRHLQEGRYAVPHGRRAPVLLWRSDLVHSRPRAASLWGTESGPRVAVYDSAMQIAEAALHLGFTNPYELDHEQFLAAVRLAAEQRAFVGSYWQDETSAVADFTGGNVAVGLVPRRIERLLARDQVPVDAVALDRGTAGVDVWMLLAGARHPGCMYRWLDYILSPKANAASARYLGAAPATPAACIYMNCAAVHAGDEAWWARHSLWRTPQHDCGDGRGRVCADWFAWSDAWAQIRSG
jgi:putative spermidine/putrescine transport system substrate-binding protein